MGRKIRKTNKQIRIMMLRKNLYLALIWICLSSSIGAFAIMSLTEIEDSIITLITLVALVLVIVLFYILRPKILNLKLQSSYQLLLLNSKKSLKINRDFGGALNKYLVNNYKRHFSSDYYDIWYRLPVIKTPKIFSRGNILNIVTVIKNNSAFYDDKIEYNYKQIMMNHQKHYKLNKQVIIQFKKYSEESDMAIAELNQIIAFSEGHNSITTINCGYFDKTEMIYFLHSDVYYPNKYYYYAVNQIKEIIGGTARSKEKE